MSALTDLFSAMATKIRSKTGTATTYTPPEMVSDGIDDVYEAGVAAGTPTLTGDATAADVVSGKTFYNTTTTKQTGSFAADTVNNSATATTSQSTKTPDSGKYFANFTINPQQHSDTYTPAANTAANDMGAVHNKRYVNTSGMIVPSGNKAITSNGTGIDVSSYSTASVSVTPSLQSKSAAPNVSTNKPVTPDSGYDGLSQVTITPLSHTGYSPSSSTYTSLAMGESKSIDLGANHDKRYVRVQAAAPSGNKSITANGTGIDVASYSTVSVAVPDPTLSGDADEENVLYGKTFYKNSYTKKTGSMTNNEAVSKTLSASERSYPIPAGYHDGSGSVTVPAVTATKRVGSTSTSVDVASDDWTVSLNCGDRLYLSKGVIADGYSQGAVAAASLSSQTGVDSGKTAIDASHVFSGYQGWVNGNKISGTYTAPTITSITPSDSTPVALSTTGNYNPTSSGYAIKNAPTTLTPNDSDPPAIASGVIYKGGGAGFAVATKPTKTETTLWTNTATSSSFEAQDVTLSSSIDNFDYIKIKFAMSTTYKTDAYCVECIYSKEDIRKTSTNTDGIQIGMCAKTSSSRYNARRVTYVSDTKLNFSSALQMSGSTAVNTAVLPLSIVGVKFSGITL